HADERKEAMLDLVPLARPRRKVAHRDGKGEPVGERLHMGLPGPEPRAIAPARVHTNQQAPRLRIGLAPQQPPPASNALHRKPGVLLGDPAVDHGFIARFILDAVWDRFPAPGVGKVRDFHGLRLARRLPATTSILERSDEFFLLGVDADHWIMAPDEPPHLL